MTEGIRNKVVVITGASSGLGEATAGALSAQGARVVLGARHQDRIQALARELVASGGAAIAVITDVTDRAQVKKLVDKAVREFGRIDVMINNAGLMPQSLLERLRVDEWDRMIDVNLKGVVYGIAAALPHMQQQRSGHFIRLFCGRPQGRTWNRGLRGHKIWSARTIRRAASGSEALRHPHDGYLTRSGGHGTAWQRR
jgi:NADP-dependent 3-hydroxy acid dehydrogenase YdfG